jgi:hypothetical protein
MGGGHPIHYEDHGKPIIITSRLEKINRTIRTKMLTGTYATQTLLFKFGISKTDKCRFCEEKEDMIHMLLKCEGTMDIRNMYLESIVPNNTSDKEALQNILNGKMTNNHHDYYEYNKNCDKLCGEIHKARQKLTALANAVPLILHEDINEEDLLILNDIEINELHQYDLQIIKSDGIRENTDLCLYCTKVVAVDDEALECEKCKGWQHIVCNNIIKEEEYERLNNDTDYIYIWKCQQCMNMEL